MDLESIPRKIYNDVINNKMTINEATELLISLIEGSSNNDFGSKCLKIINKLSLKNKKIFIVLENFLVSDENPKVRAAAASGIVRNFFKDCKRPLEWIIQHENSILVIKKVIKLLNKVADQQFEFLKKKLVEKEALMELEHYLGRKIPNIPEFQKKSFGIVSKKECIISLNLSFEKYRQQGSFTALPESIGNLQALQELRLEECRFLTSLPESLSNLRSLKKLILSGCFLLKSLPESLGNLKTLRELKLEECRSLKTLPENLGELKSLQKLTLEGCNSLLKLPESMSNLQALHELKLEECRSLTTLPESLGKLSSLQKLKLEGCYSLKKLPESLKNLYSLQKLTLVRCNNLISLPKGLKNLKFLRKFKVEGCNALKSLPRNTINEKPF
ncbi:MAG: leucine-rich repeat domain-containing protein [Promethearchaeota archaeon]